MSFSAWEFRVIRDDFGTDAVCPDLYQTATLNVGPWNGPPTPRRYLLPTMNVRVFNGEVIGFLFEVDAKDGWKPWYDEPEGKPRSHGGDNPHYTQLIMIKKGPTAEECKTSKGPYGK